MKNVRLIDRGIPRLYEIATGRPVDVFNTYSDLLFNSLYQSSGASTPHLYCPDVAHFLDYCYETGVLGDRCLTPKAANITICQYQNYLTEAENSKDFIVRRAAKALNRKPVSKVAAARYIAAVNHFLHASTTLIHDTASFTSILFGGKPVPLLTLPAVKPRRRSQSERGKILENTLQYGARRSDFAFAPGGIPSPKLERDDSTRDFPTRHILSLLRSAPSALYRCLWALQAGGGLRISEAFLIKLSDIHRKNRTIQIEDPDNQRDPSKKRDGSALPFKGRQTTSVIMFEPYKSIFFEALDQYRAERPASSSDFLFVSEKPGSYGEPIILSEKFNSVTKAYNETLKNIQRSFGMTMDGIKLFTSHSLRHFYGNWARNCVHIPGRSRIGLELSEIQLLMGHKDIKSTERYARLDAMNIAAEIAAANQLVHCWSSSYSADLVRGQTYARLADELMARAA